MKYSLIALILFLSSQVSFSIEIKHHSCNIYFLRSLWSESLDDYPDFDSSEIISSSLAYVPNEKANDFFSIYKKVFRDGSLEYYDQLEGILSEKGFIVQQIEIPIFLKKESFVERRHPKVKEEGELSFDPEFKLSLKSNFEAEKQEATLEVSGTIYESMETKLASIQKTVQNDFIIDDLLEIKLDFLEHKVNGLLADALENLRSMTPDCRKTSVEEEE